MPKSLMRKKCTDDATVERLDFSAEIEGSALEITPSGEYLPENRTSIHAQASDGNGLHVHPVIRI